MFHSAVPVYIYNIKQVSYAQANATPFTIQTISDGTAFKFLPNLKSETDFSVKFFCGSGYVGASKLLLSGFSVKYNVHDAQILHLIWLLFQWIYQFMFFFWIAKRCWSFNFTLAACCATFKNFSNYKRLTWLCSMYTRISFTAYYVIFYFQSSAWSFINVLLFDKL